MSKANFWQKNVSHENYIGLFNSKEYLDLNQFHEILNSEMIKKAKKRKRKKKKKN